MKAKSITGSCRIPLSCEVINEGTVVERGIESICTVSYRVTYKGQTYKTI